MRAAWILPGKPALLLAPMEGVTDAPMRALQTELGAFTHTVTEFLRVSRLVPPDHIFQRHLPELATGSRTKAGIPVQLQLLGGDPGRLAETARAGVRLGAPGIDLNFGCPAPTVNSHDGGATLLKHPARIEEIVGAVRRALPPEIPVSAKLRLGWENQDDIFENARRAAQGGASWITVHARTRMQGYRPPVSWGHLGELRRQLSVPLVANGDLFSVEDFRRCREESGCTHFMLGRGALANPYLPAAIARELGLPAAPLPAFPGPDEWRTLLSRFLALCEGSGNPVYGLRRVKQWLRYAHEIHGHDFFQRIKRLETEAELRAALFEEPRPALLSPVTAPAVDSARDRPRSS